MDRFIGKVAVVTGASSGIGAATAEKLVDEGMQVVGFGRNKAKLDELVKKLSNRKGKIYAVQADMSIEEDILRAFKWTLDNVGPVYVLINNAGCASDGNLLNGVVKDWKIQMDTMILGLCIATKEAVNMMTSQNIAGHIVHINSIFSHSVSLFMSNNMNIYPAIKHATYALTETLRLELNVIKSNIKISSVSPGLTNTNIADGLALNPNLPYLEPADVADAIIYMISRPPRVQIHDIQLKPVGEFA